MLIRPEPVGSVNSGGAMPTLRRTHSTESALPVAIAILGMSPSLWFCGMRVEKAVLVQAAVLGTTTWRRQRPDVTTSGMLAPTGTLVRVKVPSVAVMVPTSGEPEGGWPTMGQLTPGVKASTGALGM